MFTVQMEKQPEIWAKLLNTYLPAGGKIIDFTAGTERLHKGLAAKYQLTLCDAEISSGHLRDLTKHDYDDLGEHDAGVYDSPYLINRVGFDYTPSNGRDNWAVRAQGLETHTRNQSVAEFNQRVDCLNIKAPTVLSERGLLFVKIMDPRYQGQLVPHHFEIYNRLTNFELIDQLVYIRQGATTWSIQGHAQNLHGYWQVYRLVPKLVRQVQVLKQALSRARVCK